MISVIYAALAAARRPHTIMHAARRPRRCRSRSAPMTNPATARMNSTAAPQKGIPSPLQRVQQVREHTELVREALDTWKGPREEVTVATKVGLRRAWDGDKPIWPRDGKPEHLIEYGKQSAQALGVDSIDLLYLHRHDPEVPYNESCEGIKALLDQGVAQWAGVSNVSIEQLKIAQEILGDKLVAVQNQYSPIHLETQDTLEYCAKEGLAFVCWSPLGGYRHPYDEHLFDPFREVAAKHGVSYQRVVLAWELAKGDHMFVIPGAHRPETILDSLKADELELADEELAFLG